MPSLVLTACCAEFVLGSPEIMPSATLVNNYLVCLRPVGTLNRVKFDVNYLFQKFPRPTSMSATNITEGYHYHYRWGVRHTYVSDNLLKLSVTPCLSTYSGKCCALPFVYRGDAVSRCLVDPQTQRSWCATTPNFDKEKKWGYCQPTGTYESLHHLLGSKFYS